MKWKKSIKTNIGLVMFALHTANTKWYEILHEIMNYESKN